MTCDKCKADKSDVMARTFIIDKSITDAKGNPITNPNLCTSCCSTYPGREWMRTV